MAEYSLLFILGACIGSFLNVVIIRIPKGESVIRPRSHCKSCGLKIDWYFNIPIFSFLLLKGRCIKCGASFSIKYLIVELISAILTVLLYKKLGISFDFFIMATLVYLFIALAFIDLEYKAVPDTLLFLSFIVGMISFYGDFLNSFKNALLFTGFFVLLEYMVTFYIQNIKSKIIKDESLKDLKALGDGDIPVIAIIGGVLGVVGGITAIFLAALFAIIPSLYYKFKNKELETPFIPFLLAGFLVEYLFSISKGLF